MKTAWLIYRPVLDYEESETPLAICLSENAAKAAVDDAIRKVTRCLKKIDPRPDEEGSYEIDLWYAHREAVMEKFKWPFGVNLKYDFYDLHAPSQVYKIQELPLI